MLSILPCFITISIGFEKSGTSDQGPTIEEDDDSILSHIIQCREMCSLHLTHASVQLPGTNSNSKTVSLSSAWTGE